MNESAHGESGVIIPLRCPVCGESFPATIGDAMADKLRRAGVTGEEIAVAITGGLHSGQILCPSCAQARQN